MAPPLQRNYVPRGPELGPMKLSPFSSSLFILIPRSHLPVQHRAGGGWMAHGDGYSLRKCSEAEEPWEQKWSRSTLWNRETDEYLLEVGPGLCKPLHPLAVGLRRGPARCQGHIQVGLSLSTCPALIKHGASQSKRRMRSKAKMHL